MVAATEITAPAERPPRSVVGPLAWVRANLFSSWGNTLLTLIGLFITYQAVAGIISWAILSATFTGADGSACTREGAGACWPFITAKFAQFMYGRYPDAERWRVDLVYLLALAGLVPLMIPRVPGKFWNADLRVRRSSRCSPSSCWSGGVLGPAARRHRRCGAACW